MNIEIKKVSSRRDLMTFIKFPEKLYADEPNFIPCLRSDEVNTLSPKKNGAFAYCEAEYFLAYKDGKVAGRVAAIINHNANADWGRKTVRFGWIDFIEDFDVCKALIETVEKWGLEKGMTSCSGPLGFTDMDKEGMLTEGFEHEGTFTTIYNYSYYPEFLARLGYTKEAEWQQELIPMVDTIPAEIEKYAPMIEKKYHLHVATPRNNREIKKKYARSLFECWNEAFKVLYEFSPITQRQIDDYINQYIPFVNKDLICMVCDETDRVVGFALTFPSMSKGYKAAKGSLLRGIIPLIKGLHTYDTMELLMIGVHPEYQSKGITAVMFRHLQQQYRKYGVKQAIANPKLTTNVRVQRLFGYYKIHPYQKRCSFSKEIK